MAQVTSNEMIANATIVYDTAKRRLTEDEKWLHEHGYTFYLTILGDFRTDIEKAYNKLVDRLSEDG